MPAASEAETIHARLIEVVRRARSVDVREHETGTAEAAMATLLPHARELVEEAIDVARSILQTYEPEESADDLDAFDAAFTPTADKEPNDFYRGIDELVEGGGAERVSDIAFLASTELRQKQALLENLKPNQDGWEIVASCGSALRRIAKSFTALELVLCEVEELPRELAFASELSTSLEVRRQYARLRRVIHGPEPTEASLRTRLRSIGTRIAMMVGRDIYTDLRVHDRIQLRKLQQRILDWLRDADGSTAAWKVGMRLWQDLDGFAGLLQQVNRRQELVEHDATRVRELLAVCRYDHEGALLAAIAEHGKALEGLDDELDQQLTSRTPDPRSVGEVLARLARNFSPESHGFGPSGGGGEALRGPMW